jgi:hypothetical protein
MYVKSYSMATNRNSEVMADTAIAMEMYRRLRTHVFVRLEVSTVVTANVTFFWTCDTV